MSTTINIGTEWIQKVCQGKTDDQEVVDLSLAFIEQIHPNFKNLAAINTFSDTRMVKFLGALAEKGVEGLSVEGNIIKFAHS